MRVFFYQTKIQQPQYLDTSIGSVLTIPKVINDTFCILAPTRKDADKIFFPAASNKYNLENTQVQCNVLEFDIEPFLAQLKQAGYKVPLKDTKIEEEKCSTEMNKKRIKYTLLGVRDNSQLTQSRADKNALDRIIARLKCEK